MVGLCRDGHCTASRPRSSPATSGRSACVAHRPPTWAVRTPAGSGAQDRPVLTAATFSSSSSPSPPSEITFRVIDGHWGAAGAAASSPQAFAAAGRRSDGGGAAAVVAPPFMLNLPYWNCRSRRSGSKGPCLLPSPPPTAEAPLPPPLPLLRADPWCDRAPADQLPPFPPLGCFIEALSGAAPAAMVGGASLSRSSVRSSYRERGGWSSDVGDAILGQEGLPCGSSLASSDAIIATPVPL